MNPRLRLLRRERRIREQFFLRLLALSILISAIIFVTL